MEWFQKVILVLNAWVFLPFLFMAVSGMGMAVVGIMFILKLNNVMEELSHVCTQYSVLVLVVSVTNRCLKWKDMGRNDA